MAIPAALVPAARSAYRSVIRSARVTFSGDPLRHAQLLTVLRATFESPTLTTPGKPAPAPSLEEGDGSEPAVDPASPTELQKRINEWQEVANFLKQNVVQGRLNEKTGTYKLRVTEHTELGDNDDLQKPPKLPITPFPNRGKKKCWE